MKISLRKIKKEYIIGNKKRYNGNLTTLNSNNQNNKRINFNFTVNILKNSKNKRIKKDKIKNKQKYIIKIFFIFS